MKPDGWKLQAHWWHWWLRNCWGQRSSRIIKNHQESSERNSAEFKELGSWGKSDEKSSSVWNFRLFFECGMVWVNCKPLQVRIFACRKMQPFFRRAFLLDIFTLIEAIEAVLFQGISTQEGICGIRISIPSWVVPIPSE